MKKPFFSLIVPCYNSGDTIEKLLDGMLLQHMPKEEIEIILCDDNSTEPYYDKVEPYMDKLNIKFIHTKPREMHCPGNTRLDAMEYVTGEWLCFCDHDDYYLEDAFPAVKKYINDSKEDKLVITQICSWNEDTQTMGDLISNNTAWLHGKFYNMKNLIKKFNINFKENLYTHEDIYFNSLVLATIFSLGYDNYPMINILTYHWVNNPNSITRSFQSEKGYSYVEMYYQDYIDSASLPFIQKIDEGYENFIFKHLLITTLLNAYFYYQCQVFTFGKKQSEFNFIKLLKFRDLVKEKIKMKGSEIVDYVHANASDFIEIRNDCYKTQGHFIETISFLDFMKTKG